MAAATPISPQYPNKMPWIAAVAALVCLYWAGWLHEFAAVLGIIGFIAAYVLIRRTTTDDKTAMTVFMILIALFIIVPTVWNKYQAVQHATRRRQIISDILSAQKISTPGSLGIASYYDWCLAVEDAVGRYMQNQLMASTEKFKKYIGEHRSATPDEIATQLSNNAMEAGTNLRALDSVKTVLGDCDTNIKRQTKGVPAATSTSWSWWWLGVPGIIGGLLLVFSKDRAKTVRTLVWLGAAGAIVYLLTGWITNWPEWLEWPKGLLSRKVIGISATILLIGGALVLTLASAVTYKVGGGLAAAIGLGVILFLTGVSDSFWEEKKPGGDKTAMAPAPVAPAPVPTEWTTIEVPAKGKGYAILPRFEGKGDVQKRCFDSREDARVDFVNGSTLDGRLQLESTGEPAKSCQYRFVPAGASGS